MKRLGILLILTVIFSLPCVAETFDVLVKAGAYDRVNSPVYASVESSETVASVIVDGVRLPAQVQPLGNGSARVHWILQPLPAGHQKIYTIDMGKSAGTLEYYWKENADQSIDLFFGEKPVVSYICIPFDKNDIENTKKPFHHVFEPYGRHLLTKGVGGKYPHHRGIFVGYNKTQVGDESYDIWHARNGEHSVLNRTLMNWGGPVAGGHLLHVDWNDRQGGTFIEETRMLSAYIQPQGEMLIDFRTSLKSVRGNIRLDGDRQHAGAQFRAAQEVAEHEKTTRYLRPEAWKNLPADQQINTPEHKGLPWNAIQFSVKDQRYTVVYMTDPKNPDDAEFSERLYGRFGDFSPYDLTPEKPLNLRYWYWIVTGDDITREEIERRYQDLIHPPDVEVVR